MSQNILALDIGTKTGFAVRLRSGETFGGTQNFSLKKKDHTALRWINFRVWLNEICNKYDIHAVVYEEVRRHSATRASHVYGGFKAILEMSCYINKCQLAGFGVGQIKKFATGKGNASKSVMIAAAKLLGCETDGDDEADAFHLLNYALGLEKDN